MNNDNENTKKKIKILDQLFAHAIYSTDYQESKYIDWDRMPLSSDDKIVFYTDYSLDRVSGNRLNFAWLLESPDITSQSYRWISQNNKKFSSVFTHSKELLDRGENFQFSPTGGCWIKPEDQKIYEKNKLLSIIASSKRMTHGHLLRHQIVDIYKDKMDVYGRVYNPIDYKLDGLKDYSFSFVIENTKKDYYFTEKLIDCFMTGTVPIYWGCPSIDKFFNMDGMIIFDRIQDLSKIISDLSFEKYNKMINAINENFEKANEYLIAEDYIYKNYLENK